MTQYRLDEQNNYWLRPGFGGIAYSDGAAFEDSLLQLLKSTADKSVFSPHLAPLMQDWRSEYHLTPVRHCLMRPVPIKPGERVLELGCGCGAITRYLGEIGAEVTAVEGGAARAAIAAERCRDLNNVKVVLDDLVLFESDELFDWVTLIGVLEYSPAFVTADDPTLAYLRQALRYLKPGGKLVLAIENQLGLKYFNACGEDHMGTPFYGINGLYGPGTAVTFGRNRLERQLRAAGCSTVEFAYAFPDYKLPSVIVRDEAFNTPGVAVSDMLLRMESRDYGKRPFRLFSEQLAADTLEDNGLLQHCANSFLVIASPSEVDTFSGSPLAWCFSVSRQDEFRTQTTFSVPQDGRITVEKLRLQAPDKTVTAHPDAPWLTHRTGKSDYIAGKLAAWPVLKAKLLPDPLAGLTRAFLPYARELLERSRPTDEARERLESWMTPGSLIDFTPFNLVASAGALRPIDEEWSIDGEIPTGWVLARAIIQTLAHGLGSEELAEISLQTLFGNIVTSLELHCDETSLEQWLELEQHFLRIATGREMKRFAPDAPISLLNPWRHLNPDRLPSSDKTRAANWHDPAYNPVDADYGRWLAARQMQASDGAILGQTMLDEWKTQPLFHLLVRVPQGSEPLLADTLESLNYQLYNRWSLDILADQPCPNPALTQIPGVCWHHIPGMDGAKTFIDPLIAARGADWILEIPAGTQFDPLCLWRVTHEINAAPQMMALYLDDDLVTSTGTRSSPRFKPGTNPAWLCSMDLAGPLFVRRELLREIRGTSPTADAYWFDLLLRVLEAVPAESIGHVSGPLLSYASFPGTGVDDASYRQLIDAHLQRLGRRAEVVAVCPGTWAIEEVVDAAPLVSIIIANWDHLEFLEQALQSVTTLTRYPNYEIIVVDDASGDPGLVDWLADFAAKPENRTRVLRTPTPCRNLSHLNNLGAREANGEFLLFLGSDTVVLQEEWLDRLVRLGSAPDVAGVTAKLLRAGDGRLDHAGYVLGLGGVAGSPYAMEASLLDSGYLNCLYANRQVSAIALDCALIRRADYLGTNGMDEAALPGQYADIDLSLRLTATGKRLLFAASVAVANYAGAARVSLSADPESAAQELLAVARSTETILQRWGVRLGAEPFWNRALSLATSTPSLELDTQPLWELIPARLPKILAKPLSNVQGVYRITAPLAALRNAGRVLPCIDTQKTCATRELAPIEISRLSPDSIITQNYLTDLLLGGLREWRKALPDAFIVYALDDLATRMPEKSSLRQGVPADTRSRLQFALSQCDRLVVSTDYLAEAYGRYCREVIVVPNRLERDRWLSLRTQRGTSPRPRIGWAGGTAHRGDLELLKPVIEATRDRADWIFFGMCPDELRPLISEYHEFMPYNLYPEKIAALNLDLAVAPLEDIPFNHGKSNLRLLEYGALALPVVCSDVTPYRNSPACRVRNTPQDWLEAIQARLDQPAALAAEGLSMRQWVEAGFILEDHLDEWLNAHLPR